jgi:hypothetical protein
MNFKDELLVTINMMNKKTTQFAVDEQFKMLKLLIQGSDMSNKFIKNAITNLDIALMVGDYNVRKKILYDLIKSYQDKK